MNKQEWILKLQDITRDLGGVIESFGEFKKDIQEKDKKDVGEAFLQWGLDGHIDAIKAAYAGLLGELGKNATLVTASKVVESFQKQKVSAASNLKKLVNVFTANAWKVVDKEKTEGADKAWLEREDPWKIEQVMQVLEDADFPVKRDKTSYSDELIGKGFHVELQDEDAQTNPSKSRHLFIAVSAGSRAEEYEMGMDV